MSILAAVALVRALSLPTGFTVDPVGSVPKIVFAGDGAVAAIAHAIDDTYRSQALRWTASGKRESFAGLPVLTVPGARQTTSTPDPNYNVQAAGIVDAGSQLFVTASTSWSGAYSGISFEVQRWGSYSAARWPLPSCVYSGDSVDQHAFGGDPEGRIALTIDRTGAGSFQVMQDHPEQFAPYAYVVRGSSCRALGRAIVQGVRGPWAAGYRGFLNGNISPDNLNPTMQHIFATRWFNERQRELGPGDALAINTHGFSVGADALPMERVGCMTTNFFSANHFGRQYCPAISHAMAWNVDGQRIALAPHSPQSVAYAVNDNGAVVGMLTDAHKRHFAFRWRHGVLQRLDDLPHPAGWRFESAYAIANDGSIAGIGTLNGVATVFVWKE